MTAKSEPKGVPSAGGTPSLAERVAELERQLAHLKAGVTDDGNP